MQTPKTSKIRKKILLTSGIENTIPFLSFGSHICLQSISLGCLYVQKINAEKDRRKELEFYKSILPTWKKLKQNIIESQDVELQSDLNHISHIIFTFICRTLMKESCINDLKEFQEYDLNRSTSNYSYVMCYESTCLLEKMEYLSTNRLSKNKSKKKDLNDFNCLKVFLNQLTNQDISKEKSRPLKLPIFIDSLTNDGFSKQYKHISENNQTTNMQLVSSNKCNYSSDSKPIETTNRFHRSTKF